MRNLFISIFILSLTLEVTAQKYYAYVAAESEDEVALISFDGEKAHVEETIEVGYQLTEIEGPHGLTIDPSGEYWYLTMAHGNPYGKIYKYSTSDNKYIGEEELGIFPASMQISKATGMLFCVNFNLHGKMVPSSVSVVDPLSMSEITKITTGSMPHGSRISPDGLRHYSVAMMSGELFEIDVLSLKVARTLNLDQDKMDHSKMDHSKMDHSKMNHGMEAASSKMKHSMVKPTWVIPHPDNKRIFVAGNGSNQVLEIDRNKWEITKKYPTGNGPYNVELTPDGSKMVVTYKSDGTTGIWDLNSGKELAVIKNSREVSHGIAISDDSKVAFVSIEGKGSQPGSVDVISLESLELVDIAEVGKQAGGITFWKRE